METRRFGPTDRAVAVIGQGTWQLDANDRASAVAALRRGLDLGMTHVDTAEMYGAAESIVGEAIAGRRDEVFLVSKVLPENASRKGAVAALEDTIAAFEQLLRDGKIWAWGVSNFDVSELDEVRAIAGDGHPACNQVLYHLKERGIEHGVVPWCVRHGVAVVGYSPFGSGDFPSPKSAGGRVLARIAAAHGATPRQVALRFLVREPALFAIPKASSAAHAEENAKAGDLALSPAELAQIDAAFPRGPRPRELPTI
jgi:diketogulonate reductase-like aldo/keto reductase